MATNNLYNRDVEISVSGEGLADLQPTLPVREVQPRQAAH